MALKTTLRKGKRGEKLRVETQEALCVHTWFSNDDISSVSIGLPSKYKRSDYVKAHRGRFSPVCLRCTAGHFLGLTFKSSKTVLPTIVRQVFGTVSI